MRIGEEQKPQIVEEGPHRGDDEADDEEDEVSYVQNEFTAASPVRLYTADL